MNYYDILLAKKLAENEGGGGSSVEVEPLSVTENGTYTAEQSKAFSPVTVSVPQGVFPSGTYSITENGIYDITNFASASVNVSGGDSDSDGLIARTLSGNITNSTISKIGDYAFYQYTSMTGCNFTNVSEIGPNAFLECNVQTISFPNATLVGFDAFRNNFSTLSSAYFPKLATIESYAFQGCTNLAYFYAPNLVSIDTNGLARTSITEANYSLLTTVGDEAFWACSLLSSVNMPMISFIADGVFGECTSLRYVNIPNASYIGQYAFASCQSLESVSFPNVTSTSNLAFYDCESLVSAYIPNLEYIPSSIFNNCYALKSAYFSLASYIGRGAFYNCSSLTDVSIPQATSVGSSAFMNCNSLQIINLPNVSILYSNAFAWCSALTTVDLPLCSLIGNSAFELCSSLKNINIPLANRFSAYAFARCPSLETVSFSCPSGYMMLYSYAFQSCTSLRMVSLTNVSVISAHAFGGCSRLESVYILGSIVGTFHASAFYNTPISNSTYLGYFGSIFVPESLVASYKSKAGWSVYSSRITAYVE